MTLRRKAGAAGNGRVERLGQGGGALLPQLQGALHTLFVGLRAEEELPLVGGQGETSSI